MFIKIIRFFLGIAKKFLFKLALKSKTGPMQKTVCIVRTDAIGDFVLFSQILPYFKKIYPGYKIVLIGNNLWKELAEWVCKNKILGDFGYDYFDEFFTIKEISFHRSPFYYYKTLIKLRAICPEVVIQPTFSRTPKGDELVLIFKEAEKIGYDGDLTNIKKEKKRINDAQYTRLIKNPESPLETEKNKHFLNQIKNSSFEFSSGPEWHISENLLNEGRDFLKGKNIDILKPIIMVSPGAGEYMRCWPAENYILFMRRLSDKYPLRQFLLIGGQRDKKICDKIEMETKNLPVYNFCGAINLPELPKLMALSILFIGNESGPLHMALAIGIKTIGIVGGGYYDRYPAWKTGPKNILITNKMECFNDGWKCAQKVKKNTPPPCIKGIKVDDVFIQAVKF